jgi:glycosyltransferase involved in cell wall biosynthesis
MKIAFLNIYQNKTDRGAETFVKELSVRLSKDHKVDIISGNETSQNRWPILWRFYLDPDGIKIFLFTLKNIPKIIREKYDFVIPLNGGWQVAFVRLITWLYGGKVIISGQSGIGCDDLNNLWSFPDAFVALSSKAEKWAKKKNPFVKVFHIPNGVNLEKFGITKNKLDNLNLKRPIILCVSALTKTKRVDLVIRAVSKIKEASLLIVGDGDQKKYLTILAEKLLKGRYIITKIPYSEIEKVYNTADLFSIVSEPYYSFEIVILEAMASGLGVVVNDDPIRREIVGEAGLFVNPNNTDKYAKAIESALKLNWNKKAIAQVGKYSWDKIAIEYENLFNKLTK